jgi:predicted ribosomally synthesized peptide with SipW-like signal peptide
MNSKIILSLLVIGVVSAVAIGGTVAYFSDTETSTGNTFTAGTLDLNVDDGNINVVKFTVTDANPGATGGGTWIVKNVGSVAGYLDLEAISQINDDNGCTEPEAAVPDTTCGAGEGELGANMNIDLFVDANNNGVNDSETVIYAGPLSGIAASYDLSLALAAAATNYIRLNYTIPTTVGNIIQSDSTTLNLSFELGQTAAQ